MVVVMWVMGTVVAVRKLYKIVNRAICVEGPLWFFPMLFLCLGFLGPRGRHQFEI